MLPGKTYTPEDYLRMAWARKWWVLVPALVIAAGTTFWSSQLPNRYRSETSILIVPQRVPEEYVRSTVTTQLEDRLQMINQQILSRTRLERIVQEFNLYAAERKSMILEDVIEQMRRRDVRVDIVNARRGRNDVRAFRVSYESPNARTAMLVAERLASLFITENLNDREVLATSTNQFLEAQLGDARVRLVEHEKRLEEFRRQNAGQLPSQMQSNLQMLQNTQTQLQGVIDAAGRDRDRLLFLQRTLADAAPIGAPAAAATVPPAGPAPAAAQLEAARTALHNLELRLKPAHPDIARARRVVAELEKRADAEALQQPVSADVPPPPPATPAERAARSRLSGMEDEVEQLQRKLQASALSEARLQALVTSYRARLEAAPALESRVAELTRDYSTLQEAYTSLLKKSEESKIAANLERRQIGEQFRILDEARLPETPVSPDRTRLNFMGLLAGLAFGVGLVVLLEYRDTTLKTDGDVVASLTLPVLAVVPMMRTAREQRRTQRRRIAAWSASVALILCAAGMAAWKLRLIEAWVR